VINVLSWNVAGRRDQLAAQLERVLGQNPDVLALQELTASTYAPWCAGLLEAGYSVVSTVDLLSVPYPPPIKRKNFNLLAARHTVALLPGLSFPDAEQAAVAFPEKYLATQVVCDGLVIEVHNAHLPPGSTRGIIKPHAFQAIRRRLDEATDQPQILCGDFNSPASEDEEGVTTWGHKHPSLRAMWDEAEQGVLQHPRLRDVYRSLRTHGDEFEWSHRTRSGPKRYDHIYVSEELEPRSCRYWSEWVNEGLSDHAAVEAELTPAAARSA